MRKWSLLASVVTALTVTVSAVAAQGTQPAAPPSATAPAPGDQPSRNPGLPGVYVTPTPPQRAPAAGGDGAEGKGAAPHGHGGGCQYVPRKLDLIV